MAHNWSPQDGSRPDPARRYPPAGPPAPAPPLMRFQPNAAYTQAAPRLPSGFQPALWDERSPERDRQRREGQPSTYPSRWADSPISHRDLHQPRTHAQYNPHEHAAYPRPSLASASVSSPSSADPLSATARPRSPTAQQPPARSAYEPQFPAYESPPPRIASDASASGPLRHAPVSFSLVPEPRSRTNNNEYNPSLSALPVPLLPFASSASLAGPPSQARSVLPAKPAAASAAARAGPAPEPVSLSESGSKSVPAAYVRPIRADLPSRPPQSTQNNLPTETTGPLKLSLSSSIATRVNLPPRPPAVDPQSLPLPLPMRPSHHDHPPGSMVYDRHTLPTRPVPASTSNPVLPRHTVWPAEDSPPRPLPAPASPRNPSSSSQLLSRSVQDDKSDSSEIDRKESPELYPPSPTSPPPLRPHGPSSVTDTHERGRELSKAAPTHHEVTEEPSSSTTTAATTNQNETKQGDGASLKEDSPDLYPPSEPGSPAPQVTEEGVSTSRPPEEEHETDLTERLTTEYSQSTTEADMDMLGTSDVEQEEDEDEDDSGEDEALVASSLIVVKNRPPPSLPPTQPTVPTASTSRAHTPPRQEEKQPSVPSSTFSSPALQRLRGEATAPELSSLPDYVDSSFEQGDVSTASTVMIGPERPPNTDPVPESSHITALSNHVDSEMIESEEGSSDSDEEEQEEEEEEEKQSKMKGKFDAYISSLPDYIDSSTDSSSGSDDEDDNANRDSKSKRKTAIYLSSLPDYVDSSDDNDNDESRGDETNQRIPRQEKVVVVHEGSEFEFDSTSDADENGNLGTRSDDDDDIEIQESAEGDADEEATQRAKKRRRVGTPLSTTSKAPSIEPKKISTPIKESVDLTDQPDTPISIHSDTDDSIIIVEPVQAPSTLDKAKDQSLEISSLPPVSRVEQRDVGSDDDLEEGEVPIRPLALARTRLGDQDPLTSQGTLFARIKPTLGPNGKAVYKRRPLAATTMIGTLAGSAEMGTSAVPGAAGKGSYVRRNPTTLDAAFVKPSIGTTTATKATYERRSDLILDSSTERAKPPKPKGALPLDEDEKVERLSSKLQSLFTAEFPRNVEVPYSKIFAAPIHSANPSKASVKQPDEKASWGYWPSPAPLKAGKAVFPAPQIVNDPVHDARPRVDIFIDNSNVIYSFLNWARERNDAKVIQKLYKTNAGDKGKSVKVLTLGGKKIKMDYRVLFGLLERGRKVERRILVGSSPLWQSLEPAVNWGYEVSLLQRVPRTFPVDPQAQSANSGNASSTKLGSNLSKKRDKSGKLVSVPKGGKEVKHYKEQAVDELVHLKILESILDYTPSPLPLPPPALQPPMAEVGTAAPVTETGTAVEQQKPASKDSASKDKTVLELNQEENAPSPKVPSTTTAAEPILPVLRARSTLVIATGDANSSEYNPGGFLGCVTRALDRGWDVEIASFSTHGMSPHWNPEKHDRVTADGRMRGELRIVNLESFAEELLL
ncbi:uncharacterized protein JCM15063_006382 [Sporobolomyces koalae]|uniref:uncharacterized protein n=1 Tax=Sporobolomyces koalae TaxID=500713 RepID=UPI0031823D1B